MQLEKNQNIRRMVSLKGIRAFLNKAIGERTITTQLRLSFVKVSRIFFVGFSILGSLMFGDDFATRFFTMITLGMPFLFVFGVLPIVSLINFLVPALAIKTPLFSWLDWLGVLGLMSLIWAGIMTVRVFIKWRFYH